MEMYLDAVASYASQIDSLVLLITASLIFYAAWSVPLVSLIVISAVVDFTAGRLLDRYGAAELEAAIAEALSRGVPHPNAVRLAMEKLILPEIQHLAWELTR